MYYLQYILCGSIDWSAIGTIITAAATIALVFVGRRQLNVLNKTNKEVFLNNLKKEFFKEQARQLLFLIEHDALIFEINDNFAFFKNKLSNKIIDHLKNAGMYNFKDGYTTNEIDDFLLQHFEDLGLYLEKGIITVNDADQTFGYYVRACYEDPEIKSYIRWAQEDDLDIYSNLESLYKKLPKPKEEV